ncbi:uncharacterized protein G2W53_031018 [Senna tora]|uniref:Uncharacterized protein n=1 Tax=Senna tora TaxID=362788 RepID=A0A834TGP8_9FABA|nr:uncharacterized protein G2W53_031018 [Senna tora]
MRGKGIGCKHIRRAKRNETPKKRREEWGNRESMNKYKDSVANRTISSMSRRRLQDYYD